MGTLVAEGMAVDGLELRLLGGFDVVAGGRSLPLGGARQRAVLARLVISANELVPTDQLIDQVWGGVAPPGAVTTLQVYVSHLRKALAGTDATIETRRPGYVLVVAPTAIDARRFEQLVARADARLDADPADAAALLREALALWRGPALADFAFESFASVEASRLDELRLRALEQRIEADLALGRAGDVVAELEALVAEHPLREGFWRQLMLALYRTGRQSEALRAYRRAGDHLRDELGLEPGVALQRLEQAILVQDELLDVEEQPVAAAPTVTVLPKPLTSFVGREREVAEVRGLLERARLVSLTGAGGTGKTRLALETAARASAAVEGVWLVELAGLVDPTLVPGAVASALGLHEETDRSTEAILIEALADRDCILVVDNCEHLLQPVAELCARLLSACARLRVLATSREPLNVGGEIAWPVPTLPAPVGVPATVDVLLRFDAARLFVERAATASPGWAPTDRDIADISRICARLDGIPLAIELAAARLRTLSLAEISSRLDDRLRLLASTRRDVLPRHRTLRAAVEWSYDLLDETERAVFARAALFAAAFSLEAAEFVCDGGDVESVDAVDLISSLVNKSLVILGVGGDGAPRYRMLESLRSFGLERLAERGEQSETARRHAAYFTASAEAEVPKLVGATFQATLDRLEAEHDEYRLALAWLTESGDADGACRLAGALWPFWDHGYYAREGRSWLARVLADKGVAARHRLHALVGSAYLAWLEDDVAAVEEACLEGLALNEEVGDQHAHARLLLMYAELARIGEGGVPKAEALAVQAVDLFAEVGDMQGEADARRVLTLLAWDRGDLQRATSMAERCLELFSDAGDIAMAAGASSMLAGLARERGDLQIAQRRYENSLRDFTMARDPQGAAHVLRSMSNLAFDQGDHENALRHSKESLRRYERLGNPRGVLESLRAMADAYYLSGDLERAGRLADDAVERFRERGFAGDLVSALQTSARVALARGDVDLCGALAEEALVPYRTEGHTRDAASALCLLSRVRARQNDAARSLELAEESRVLYEQAGDRRGLADALEARAEGALAGGDAVAAADALTQAGVARRASGVDRSPVAAAEHHALVSAVRAALAETGDPSAGGWDPDVIDLRDRADVVDPESRNR
jgi:predicted ATPase/DNA-binding SARP family transcriptional activator